MGSISKKVMQQYLSQLQKHPLGTKAITAGVLSAVSDIVSQKLSGIQKLQLRRLLLKVIFGAAYLGPIGHYFHLFLDKLFKGKKDTKTVAKKVVVEQLTISPWNNLFFMIYYGSVIEDFIKYRNGLGKGILYIDTSSFIYRWQTVDGKPFSGRPWMHVKSKIKKEYPAVQYTAWTFWPVVGWINHQYLPLELRVVFQSMIAFCWGIFLNLRVRSLTLTKG